MNPKHRATFVKNERGKTFSDEGNALKLYGI